MRAAWLGHRTVNLLLLYPMPVAQRKFMSESVDGKPKQITHVKGDVADLRWSPDGKRIAFLNISGGGAGGPLAAVPVQTGVIGSRL